MFEEKYIINLENLNTKIMIVFGIKVDILFCKIISLKFIIFYSKYMYKIVIPCYYRSKFILKVTIMKQIQRNVFIKEYFYHGERPKVN